MDKKDMELLEILGENARVSSKELATMLSLSENETNERIKKLKQAGILKKFKAVIDWDKAGRNYVTAYIDVKMVPEAREGFKDVCELIAAHEKVEEVCLASGAYDILLKVRCKDLNEVSHFVTEVLASKRTITGTVTHFVLKRFKENGVILDGGKKDKQLLMSP